jgi:hypothetical protein
VREPELLKAVTTSWAAVANSSTLVPGGLHWFRASADNVPVDPNTGKKAEIYAIVKADEQPIARHTNGGVVREHIITITVKHNEGAYACAAILQAMGNRSTGIKGNMPSLEDGGTVIDMWPYVSQTSPTENERQGKPIADAAIAWRVQSSWAY